MNSTSPETVLDVLSSICYHFPTHLHELLVTLWMLYTSSHASLTRPSSAARPSNTKSKSGENDRDSRESSFGPEGLSPLDAVMFPVFAALMLTGMYALIKWLDDPELLNKIMRWLFSFVSLVSLTQMSENGIFVIYSFVSPQCYTRDGKLWALRRDKDGYEARTMTATLVQSSPVPGWTSTPPFSPAIINYLWCLRDFARRKIRLRVHHRGHTLVYGGGPLLSIVSFILSFFIVVFSTLFFRQPYWLINNFLAHSFVYTYMSIISPAKFSTGALLLVCLFFYDIYMVFYTPMMEKVATTMEIPAKLLIPQPGSDRMAMLGLGDVLLPGLVVAWALRFDLHLWYHQQQRSGKRDRKPEYLPATGRWGERFWTSTLFSLTPATKSQSYPDYVKGTLFAKPYFHASLIGYTLGLALAGVMVQIYYQAQPALLYLVPGVLGAIIITAVKRGELGELWNYEEGKEDEEESKKKEAEKKNADQSTDDDGKKKSTDDGNKTWRQPLEALWATSILSTARTEKLQARLNSSKNPHNFAATPLESNGHTIINFPFLHVELLPPSDILSLEERKADGSTDLKKGYEQQHKGSEGLMMTKKTVEEKLAERRKENEGVYERELKELKKMR